MKPRPKQRVLRKRQNARFSTDYFEEDRRYFNQNFLTKSLVEKSGMLAKLYRTTTIVEGQLRNIFKDSERILESAKTGKRRFDLKTLAVKKIETEKIWKKLLQQTSAIFTERYYSDLTETRIRTPHTTQLHQCVHLIMKIQENYEKLLKYT